MVRSAPRLPVAGLFKPRVAAPLSTATRVLPCAALLCAAPLVAAADVPSVATDIAPVHSLVAQVMGDLGSPDLIVPPGASPHGYAMRPSEARALSSADLVVWVGEGLTPWLAGPIETLAEDAHVLELIEAPQTQMLEFRENAVFSPASQDADDAAGHEEHDDEAHEDGHEDHDDEAHEDGHEGHVDDAHEDGHEDHADEAHEDDHEDHDDHGHDDHAHEAGDADPHAWLDPQNGQIWLGLIATELSELDPENAAQYAENAQQAQAELKALEMEIAQSLAPLHGMSFVVLHDAYQYFEARFGLEPLGAVTLGDATDPSAARVSELRDAVRAQGVTCVVSQPQFNPSLVQAVIEGTEAGFAVLDPLGVEITPGPELYGQVLKEMTDALDECR